MYIWAGGSGGWGGASERVAKDSRVSSIAYVCIRSARGGEAYEAGPPKLLVCAALSY
jgi:hypothetical protein